MDSFGWMREEESPSECDYLEAENAYAEQATAHLSGLKADLIAELEGRRPREESVPELQVGPFVYFQKAEPDLAHPVWWRRPASGGPAESILDPNTIPGAEVFFELGVFEPSEDGRYVAFSFDVVGDEAFELRVRDLTSGDDVWRDSRRPGHVVWAADGRNLYFTRERNDRKHHDQVIRLDIEAGESEVVFEEVNERLEVLVRRSDSGKWLFIDVLPSFDYSMPHRGAIEVWCLPAHEPQGQWRRIVTRDMGHEVFTEHWEDSFLFRVDDYGPYGRLVRTPIPDTSPSRWHEIIPHQGRGRARGGPRARGPCCGT